MIFFFFEKWVESNVEWGQRTEGELKKKHIIVLEGDKIQKVIENLNSKKKRLISEDALCLQRQRHNTTC